MSAKKKRLVYVGKSKIHGRGLFAARKIPADTLIMPVTYKPSKKDGMYVIWSREKDGWLGSKVTNDARFVNHADSPNAAYFDDELWSLRAIKKDEEITHDYTGDLGEG